MLTILEPDLINQIAKCRIGLIPVVKPDGELFLVIKATKEIIFTAKSKKGFSCYFVPHRDGALCIGMITAFFDDPDQPLVLYTALCEDEMPKDIKGLFSQATIDVYFFDDNNRELLGYSSKVRDLKQACDLIDGLKFRPPSIKNIRESLDDMPKWFGLRTEVEDKAAIAVDLIKPLFSEDLFIMDNRPEVFGYNGSKAVSYTQLERPEPGEFQEQDIVMLLQRIFPNESIYLNPFRTDKHNEFLDVLVVTDKNALFIQAKDSPNINSTIERTLERKQAVIMKQLLKASNQVRGAVAYARSSHPLEILINGNVVKIPLEGKEIRAFIVVSELFEKQIEDYSNMILEMVHNTLVACIPISYYDLHIFTNHLKDEDQLTNAHDIVFFHALKHGIFPRLRFGLNDPSAEVI